MKLQDQIVVKKFGGTSVGSLERIENVAERIFQDIKLGQKPIVVASAMSGETNRLVGLANQLYPGARGPAYDMLLASGEQVSISLLSLALEKRGIRTQPLLAYQLGIETDSLHSRARIVSIDTKVLSNYLHQGVTPIVAGFQGVNKQDHLTTLGRGGTDTSAVAIASALKLDHCEIYTDVPAVFSADPRLVEKAQEIRQLSYEEMLEMASLGSKVLQVRCVELAAKFSTKIHVRSSFETREGTWILDEGDKVEQAVVTAVTHDSAIVVYKLFPVPTGAHFPAKLFTLLSERGIVVDIITQSENNEGQRLAFSTSIGDQSEVNSVLRELAPAGGFEITQLDHMAKISVVGVGMRNHPGVAARFFQVLSDINVQLSLVTTSEIKISAVIEKSMLKEAAEKLHTQFSLDVQNV